MRRQLLTTLTASLVAFGLLAAPVAAGETDDHAGADGAQAHEGGQETHEAAGEHGEAPEAFAGHHVHHEHKNGLALGIAGTWESEEEQVFGTISLEYERMLADRWGFQAIVEHVKD